jgi:peptidoglycan/LPS O-acetylase OafA/YrhL
VNRSPRCGTGCSVKAMVRLLRIVLLVGIAMLMVGGVVIGMGAQTGPVEKAVLVAVGATLLFAADRVNRLGTSRATR